MNDDPAAIRRMARELFLRDDNRFGCAETVYLALKRIYSLPNAGDSGAAMALNGGFAHTGSICGALLGAALGLGERQERDNADHKQAKSVAREQVKQLLRRFEDAHGSIHCRDLIGYDVSIPAEHDRFIQSGIWKTQCMRQIEFTLEQLSDIVQPE
ncbi:MAG: C_GCAxxG_C_C family protein [Spirochaetaceae bacterium]|nr:MAG: C_GCAxxG_C_C family protein [Spirochaetaceae bacterium]